MRASHRISQRGIAAVQSNLRLSFTFSGLTSHQTSSPLNKDTIYKNVNTFTLCWLLSQFGARYDDRNPLK